MKAKVNEQTDLKKEHARLQKLLTTKDNALHQLSSDNATLSKENACLSKKLLTLYNARESLQKKLNLLEENIETQKTQSKESLSDIKQQLAQVHHELNEAKINAKQSSDRLTKITHELSDTQNKLSENEHNATKTEDQLKIVEQENKELREQLAYYEYAAENRLKSLKDKHTRELSDLITKHQHNLKQKQIAFDQELLKATTSANQTATNQFERTIHKLEGDNQRLTIERGVLTQRCKEIIKAIDDVRNLLPEASSRSNNSSEMQQMLNVSSDVEQLALAVKSLNHLFPHDFSAATSLNNTTTAVGSSAQKKSKMTQLGVVGRAKKLVQTLVEYIGRYNMELKHIAITRANGYVIDSTYIDKILPSNVNISELPKFCEEGYQCLQKVKKDMAKMMTAIKNSTVSFNQAFSECTLIVFRKSLSIFLKKMDGEGEDGEDGEEKDDNDNNNSDHDDGYCTADTETETATTATETATATAATETETATATETPIKDDFDPSILETVQFDNEDDADQDDLKSDFLKKIQIMFNQNQQNNGEPLINDPAIIQNQIFKMENQISQNNAKDSNIKKDGQPVNEIKKMLHQQSDLENVPDTIKIQMKKDIIYFLSLGNEQQYKMFLLMGAQLRRLMEFVFASVPKRCAGDVQQFLNTCQICASMELLQDPDNIMLRQMFLKLNSNPDNQNLVNLYFFERNENTSWIFEGSKNNDLPMLYLQDSSINLSNELNGCNDVWSQACEIACMLDKTGDINIRIE